MIPAKRPDVLFRNRVRTIKVICVSTNYVFAHYIVSFFEVRIEEGARLYF